MDALMRPRSVAVVGASDRANVGGRMFRNMRANGFKGRIWPVNPNYQTVGDTVCYPDIASLPETPDCVALAVPYEAVFAPLEAAAERGVKSAVIVAEGFADSGTTAGHDRQARLVDIAARAGMAVSGPNSQGLVGLHAGLATAFTNLPRGLVKGAVSLVSQSGGLLNAVVEHGHNRTLGFNYLLSAGNEAVVTAADYIDWLAGDPETQVILNIIEGVADGRRYREALARATAVKPVVVLKLGRTGFGSAAATAHTGSLAGSQRVFEQAVCDSGAILVNSIDQLIETANVLSRVPLPNGNRVFVFSVSGGATVLAGDLASDAGLTLPPVPRATSTALGEILGVDRQFHNPMDVVGAPRLVKGTNLTQCLDVLMSTDEFDAIALVMVVQRDISESHQVLHDQFRAYAKQAPKPVLLISEMTWLPAARPPVERPPIAATLDDGLLALRHLVEYAARRRAGRPEFLPLPAPVRPSLPANRPLTEPESYRLLTRSGLPVAPFAEATTPAAAAECAAQIGFPVAIKAIAPGLVHKSDTGGVGLNLTTPDAVVATCTQMQRDIAGLTGFMVQRMVTGGMEMIVGARYDQQFGPVVMVGAGGTLAELIDDTALALAPIELDTAHRMIASLTADRLLSGYRGGPAHDKQALAEILVQLSHFAAHAGPWLSEVDLNPVFVLPQGDGALIADALIVPNVAHVLSIDAPPEPA